MSCCPTKAGDVKDLFHFGVSKVSSGCICSQSLTLEMFLRPLFLSPQMLGKFHANYANETLKTYELLDVCWGGCRVITLHQIACSLTWTHKPITVWLAGDGEETTFDYCTSCVRCASTSITILLNLHFVFVFWLPLLLHDKHRVAVRCLSINQSQLNVHFHMDKCKKAATDIWGTA